MRHDRRDAIVALALAVEAQGAVPERGGVVVAKLEHAEVVRVAVEPRSHVNGPPLSQHL